VHSGANTHNLPRPPELRTSSLRRDGPARGQRPGQEDHWARRAAGRRSRRGRSRWPSAERRRHKPP